MKQLLLVLLIASVTCHSFDAMAGDDPGTESLLPPCKYSHDNADFYPEGARRAWLQGRVLVEFSLDAHGHPKDAHIVAEEPSGAFGKRALAMTGQFRCSVPKEWKSEGLAARRFRLSYVFKLVPCPTRDPCHAPEAYPTLNNDPVTISAERRPEYYVPAKP